MIELGILVFIIVAVIAAVSPYFDDNDNWPFL